MIRALQSAAAIQLLKPSLTQNNLIPTFLLAIMRQQTSSVAQFISQATKEALASVELTISSMGSVNQLNRSMPIYCAETKSLWA